MLLSPTKKNLIIFAIAISLSGCASPCAKVDCHEWDTAERLQIADADDALPHENPLHGVIRIMSGCASL